MRVTVNLATRPFADLGPILRRLRVAMGVLALVAILLGVGLHLLHSKAEAARATERTVDAQITQIRHEQQGYQAIISQPDNSQVLDQAAALNRLIDAKAFSWTLAMEDLETVLPGGVQVTTLEPVVDKKDGHITVRLRVVGPRNKAVELVQNLEHSRRFLQARLSNEALESAGNGQQIEPVTISNRVNFDILADYNPATPEERRHVKKKAENVNEQRRVPVAPARPMPPHPGLQRAPYAVPPSNPQAPRPIPGPPHGIPSDPSRLAHPKPPAGGPQ